MQRSIIITALIVFCANAQAEIYTCKDTDGKTIYTDSPDACTNAETVKTDELPTLIPTKPLENTSRSTSKTSRLEDKNKYTALTITSPANNSTVRENQGNITINFQVSPALQTRAGHKYVVTLTGTEVYRGTSSSTALKNVDRGTHTIEVKVVDAKDNTKISAIPVSFTLQRYSALNSVDSNSPDANAGNGDDSETTVTNQKFPSNTKFNRPATPPPATN